MADISRVVLPNQSGYDIKDKNAAKSLTLNDNDSYNYEIALRKGDGSALSYIYIDRDAKTLAFEQNQVTPNEFWIKLKNNKGEELDNHWMLSYLDNGDLVLKDLDADIEVMRLPLPLHLDFIQDVNQLNYFDMKLVTSDGTDVDVKGLNVVKSGNQLIFSQHYPTNKEICRVTL